MRLIAAGLVAFSLTALVSCSGGDDGAIAAPDPTPVTPTTTLTADPSDSGSDEPSNYEPNVGDRALRIGQTREGEAGLMTLQEIKLPYPPAEYRTPQPGNQFLGLRLKQCVREDADLDGEDFVSSSAGEWYAATPSGNQITSSSGWVDWPAPRFPDYVTVNPGECLKGWVSLEVPTGTKVEKMIWRPAGQTVAEWLP